MLRSRSILLNKVSRFDVTDNSRDLVELEKAKRGIVAKEGLSFLHPD